jgi:hypothetical protein
MKNKLTISLIALAMLACLVTVGVRPSRAASTLVVDDDGVQCPGAGFTSIQAAVTTASAGDAIQVCPGTYNEGVAVDKSLTLLGPNAGTSALAVRSPEAHITSGATTVNVTATGVTIDGFQITGDFAVYTQVSLDGLLLANNIMAGTSRALSLDGPGNGISVLGNDLSSPVRSLHVSGGNKQNVVINGNRFSGPAGTGIFFQGTNSIVGFEFKSNQVNHLANIAARISNGDVSSNTFTDAPGSLAIQINLHESTISNNTFNGNGTTRCLQLFGVQFGLDPSTNVMIMGNQFNACSGPAPNAYALQLSEGVNHILITKNTFTNSFDAISTRNVDGPWTLNSDIHINRNAIVGSTHNGINNTVNGTLDAECNWWGSPAGPPPGHNSGGVDDTPWLTTSDLDGPCVGPDADNDGITDSADNCPSTSNPGQEDADDDGVGDACDSCPLDEFNDADGDDVCGNVDNCPTTANTDQADADGDDIGDACDPCPNTPGTSCPVPANKDACKNGGWKFLFRLNGTEFKNQGDCVSYTQNSK